MGRLLTATAAMCLLCAACQGPQPRLNAPPHGTTENPSELRSMYVHMVDNALLTDMTLSDIHFMPHRPMLNTLGEERLRRLAALMERWGGTIRYNTDEPDERLVQQRTEQVLKFLAEAGLDTSAEVLRPDLPGGRGMGAPEAVLIKVNEGTYKPKSQVQ